MFTRVLNLTFGFIELFIETRALNSSTADFLGCDWSNELCGNWNGIFFLIVGGTRWYSFLVETNLIPGAMSRRLTDLDMLAEVL